MKQIRKFDLDKYIEDSAKRGIILAGISAGAIMCVDAGCSDSRKNESEQGKYLKVNGLGLQRGLIAPHYTNSGRPNDLPRMVKSCKKNTVAFGIDECAALVITDETYQLVKSSSEARVFKCYYLNGEYKSVELENEGEISKLYCLN
jgi:peptidase E